MRHLLGIDVGGTFTDFVAHDGRSGSRCRRSCRSPPIRSTAFSRASTRAGPTRMATAVSASMRLCNAA